MPPLIFPGPKQQPNAALIRLCRARDMQEALFKQGIPLTGFEVTDIQKEFQRLKAQGVVFSREPMKAGPVTVAIFSDTCGNLIQIYQPPSPT
jgi:predicted enzyme related to lactoylglutathione lyase